jgi:thymidylate synthase
LLLSGAILLETALSYLGFGVVPPDVSLGLLINQYQDAFTTRPFLFWYPGFFIVSIALSINFIGDGLRDAFDPRQKRRITKKEKRFAEGLPENEKAYYNIEGGVDQLQQIIDALKDPAQRTSRRLIMTAWNPCQLDQMSLPPCHIFCQFNVHNGDQLSCAMFQRSNDCALGIPFNIASYSFLTHLIAKHCGLEAHEFIHFMGNSHIYEDHVEPMKEQIKRNPHPFPTVSIKQVRENINDYCLDDFILENYQSHEAIKMKMVA